MKILLATEKPFAKEAVDGIKQVFDAAKYELVLLEKYTEKQQLLDAVADVEGLIVRSDIVDAQVFDAAKKLKIVVRAGAGYDNIDLEAATAHGVVVENTPGQNANAVAELAFGMLLMAIRNAFNGTSGIEIKGKRIGLQAFGQVSRNVARVAKGFQAAVSAIDPYCPDSAMEDVDVTPVHDLKELYRNNQFISIHIPSTPETRKSIGYDLITLMPKNGVLINTARKDVIDEDGLIQALADRTDLKYVTDVKPDKADEMKEKFGDRIFYTPKKMGASTSEANINAGLAAAHQIVAYLKDGIDKFKVNK